MGELEIETIREGWMLTTWERELPFEGDRMSPRLRAALAAEVADRPDDLAVALTAGTLRQLLAMIDRPRERGARIEGVGGNEGVVYLATVDPSTPRRLRTIEVIATDEKTNPDVFRVPVRLVEDLTRYVLAAEDDLLLVERVPSNGIPTPDALFELVQQGVPASGIGKLYERSEERVYQWLRQARRDRPDLDWPKPTRGPRAKPANGK